MIYWLMLMVFAQGSSPSVTHVGSFTSENDCRVAASEAIDNIRVVTDPNVPGAAYRVLCVRASDGKMPPPAR
jgi:hypothetical protein